MAISAVAAEWIAAAVAAASTAATAINNSEAADARDKANANSIMQQVQAQEKARQQLTKGISDLANSNPNAQTQANTSVYEGEVQKAKQAMLSNGSVANSDAFNAAKNTAAGGVQTYGDQIATALAGIDAAHQQRINEAGITQQTGENMGQTNVDSALQTRANNVRIASIQPNPWVNAIAGIANGVARSYMGGAAGAGASMASSAGDAANTFYGPQTNSQYGTMNSANPYPNSGLA